MTYEEYKALKGKSGPEFINASREHPEFMKRLQDEQNKEVLDDFDLKCALRYLADANDNHYGNKQLLEQARALFVSFCILNSVDAHTPLWNTILDRFVSVCKPDDRDEFIRYMSEYAELIY